MTQVRNIKMKRVIFYFFTALVFTSTVSCTENTAQDMATAIYFVEQEKGTDPYKVRMIVTKKFLRVDDGIDDGDFLLYDRKDKTIYSTAGVNRRILVIKPKAVDVSSPIKLEHQVEKDKTKLPDVGGKKVVHYRLFTNKTLCYELTVAEGLLPEGLKALREYRETLAGEQAKSLAWTPQELQTPCGLANNIFSPARHLLHGFPIRISEMTGRTRNMVDYKTEFQADPALFELPASYTRMNIDDLRKGF